MTKSLNQVETDITKEIINIGIAKAADSFSFFIQEKVIIRLMELKTKFENNFPFSRKYPTARNFLLATEIKGELTGKAYLLFDELEAEKIVSANLPDSIKNDPIARESMTEAFLLEIDNIITASVITQFSNIFQKKIYGDVPSLKILPGNEINQFLSENHTKNLNVIYFNSRFITEKIEINPEFIWLMDDMFFEEVKKVMSDEKKLELLKKLNDVV